MFRLFCPIFSTPASPPLISHTPPKGKKPPKVSERISTLRDSALPSSQSSSQRQITPLPPIDEHPSSSHRSSDRKIRKILTAKRHLQLQGNPRPPCNPPPTGMIETVDAPSLDSREIPPPNVSQNQRGAGPSEATLSTSPLATIAEHPSSSQSSLNLNVAEDPPLELDSPWEPPPEPYLGYTENRVLFSRRQCAEYRAVCERDYARMQLIARPLTFPRKPRQTCNPPSSGKLQPTTKKIDQ